MLPYPPSTRSGVGSFRARVQRLRQIGLVQRNSGPRHPVAHVQLWSRQPSKTAAIELLSGFATFHSLVWFAKTE